MFDWVVNMGLLEVCKMQSPNVESLKQLCHTHGIWGTLRASDKSAEEIVLMYRLGVMMRKPSLSIEPSGIRPYC